MKYLYSFNSHSDFYNKDMILKDDNVVLCKDTDINKWHAHYHHPPYDAEIEYLESTGTQWIDLDYYADQYTSMTAKFQYTATTAQQYLFSIRDAWDVMFGFYFNGSSKFAFSFNNATHYNATGINLAANTSLHTLSISACDTNGTVVFDTKTINLNGGTRNPGSIRLFGAVGIPPYGRPKMKLYNISFSRNGVLDCDLIPVRIGTTGYMYDKISCQLFGNAGTGNFTLGQDIVPIEYLQSSGTQYINLNFGFDKTDEVYTSFAILTTTNDKYINSPITWNNNNNRFGMGYHNGGYCIGYGNVGTTSTLMSPKTANDTKIHVWEYKNYMFKIVDLNLTRNVSSITFGGTTNNLRLFYGYNANTQAKIASYKHIKNGQTVIDLIPVRKGTTGYMYDKVSGQLFGNNGTGSFTLGPDI